MGFLLPASVQLRVGLVEDNISLVADKVIDSETPEQNAKEVEWKRPRFLWFSVILAEYRFSSLCLEQNSGRTC